MVLDLLIPILDLGDESEPELGDDLHCFKDVMFHEEHGREGD